MIRLLKEDKQWKLFVDELEFLIDKYEGIDIKTMGFPEIWKELLHLQNIVLHISIDE